MCGPWDQSFGEAVAEGVDVTQMDECFRHAFPAQQSLT
jgi:hypothetical protein